MRSSVAGFYKPPGDVWEPGGGKKKSATEPSLYMCVIEKKAYLPLDYPGYHDKLNLIVIFFILHWGLHAFSVSSCKFWTFYFSPAISLGCKFVLIVFRPRTVTSYWRAPMHLHQKVDNEDAEKDIQH